MSFVMTAATIAPDGTVTVGQSTASSQPSIALIIDTTQVSTATQLRKVMNALRDYVCAHTNNTGYP